MNYLKFVRREWRLLSFGISFTLVSSFGQTFFISLFVPFFLDEFALTNTTFGTFYSAATLTSAFLLPYIGKWIDKISLPGYSLFVLLGLSAAAIVTALSWHVYVLFAGLILLRHFGQGLSGHTAQTSMARYFDAQRGKALSIASIGYPVGEGILPILITALLGVLEWRWIWIGVAITVVILFIPGIQLLLKNTRQLNHTQKEVHEPADSGDSAYKIVLRDWRFWVILPTLIVPPFWGTALLLYQISIADQFGWTPALIASAFIFFAIMRIISSVGIGPMIDRFGAERLLPFYTSPLIVGLLMVYLPLGNWAAFVYMASIGITIGTAGNVNSALWAEWYGTKILGAIRSLFAALTVFSTALSPFIMGWLLDSNISLSTIILSAILNTVFAIILSFFAWFKK